MLTAVDSSISFFSADCALRNSSPRAVPVGANSGSAGFFLWQTKSGIKFKSVEKIIENKEVAEEYVFNRINSGLDDPEGSFHKILTYGTQHNNNVMAAQRTGEYSTYRIYFNPYTFEFTDPSKSVFKPEGQETLGTDDLHQALISFLT